MKKKLESELMSIAHRLLKLKGRDDVLKMHEEVRVLYEKLTLLKFAHDNFEGNMPTIGGDSSFFDMLDVAFNNKVSDNMEVEDRVYVNMDEKEDDGIMEPVMDKIRNLVAEMPEEENPVITEAPKPVEEKVEKIIKKTQEPTPVDTLFDAVTPKVAPVKEDLQDITAGFEETPIFEPIAEANARINAKTSLNDKLKRGGISIGLNDKIAFIKHLFGGEHEDYERVLSQVITADSFDEASHLIQNIVKPDYNQWLGKEDYETRFMEIIESKFD